MGSLEYKTLDELIRTECKCRQCGMTYIEYQNIGRWSCRMRMYNLEGLEYFVPADHDATEARPFYFIPLSVIHLYQEVHPGAKQGYTKNKDVNGNHVVYQKVARYKRVDPYSSRIIQPINYDR